MTSPPVRNSSLMGKWWWSGNWPAGVRRGLLFGQQMMKISRKTGGWSGGRGGWGGRGRGGGSLCRSHPVPMREVGVNQLVFSTATCSALLGLTPPCLYDFPDLIRGTRSVPYWLRASSKARNCYANRPQASYWHWLITEMDLKIWKPWNSNCACLSSAWLASNPLQNNPLHYVNCLIKNNDWWFSVNAASLIWNNASNMKAVKDKVVIVFY